MEEIKVSSAVSLFKENGHDLKGLFQLYINAVSADKYSSVSSTTSVVNEYSPYGGFLSP